MKTFTRFCFAATLVLAQLTAAAATHIVKVRNFVFDPQSLTINAGDIVNFQWENGTHPVVSDNNAFAAFTMAAATPTASRTFATAGSFPYHCTLHGTPGNGMFGTITVNAATPVLGAKLLPPALTLYPNPSRGMVMLTVNQKSSADYTLRISNIIGREVRAITLKPQLTEAGLPLNLSDLPAGMYICNLVQNDKVVGTKRLVLRN
ncbi:T9SS type A sorting domain-containing protein [Hymenobacter sp. BT730]|uniref:T9SS type A sorting domain-containing protein n=1 Tax=Hymenobacter sp. BT730 TaxID=3063332 RepID=UPI0026E0B980|nr:T9SS type A sorting domain-containing protein [Hymenobacter sp. BT730]